MNTKEFEKLFKRYHTAVFRFLNGILKDAELSKDIAQEVFTSLWLKREILRDDDGVRSYLFTSARNKAFDVLRSKREAVESLMPEQHASEDISTVEYSETRTMLDNAIRSLPEQRKRVFMMSRGDNLSNREIADKLGLSVRTVEKHIELSLRDLRKHIN